MYHPDRPLPSLTNAGSPSASRRSRCWGGLRKALLLRSLALPWGKSKQTRKQAQKLPPFLQDLRIRPSHPSLGPLTVPSPRCPFWNLPPSPNCSTCPSHCVALSPFSLRGSSPHPHRLRESCAPRPCLRPEKPTVGPRAPRAVPTPTRPPGQLLRRRRVSASGLSAPRAARRSRPPPSQAPAQRGPAPRSPDPARRSAHRAARAGPAREPGRRCCHGAGAPVPWGAAELAAASAPPGKRCGRAPPPHLIKACDLTAPGLGGRDASGGAPLRAFLTHAPPRFPSPSLTFPALFILWCTVPP